MVTQNKAAKLPPARIYSPSSPLASERLLSYCRAADIAKSLHYLHPTSFLDVIVGCAVVCSLVAVRYRAECIAGLGFPTRVSPGLGVAKASACPVITIRVSPGLGVANTMTSPYIAIRVNQVLAITKTSARPCIAIRVSQVVAITKTSACPGLRDNGKCNKRQGKCPDNKNFSRHFTMPVYNDIRQIAGP